tara:strand:+ start:11597 stop:12214 length:618 start_codon:yes stop_codon:yes gene_type:complete
MQPQIVPLFSQPLYINKTDLTDQMIQSVIDTPCQSDNGGHNNGWMSQTQWLKSQPEVRATVEYNLSKYVYDVLQVDETKHQLEHTSSWVNKHNPGDSGHGHAHNNAMFSGVMYFKVPPNSGDITFYVPSMIPTWCTQTLYPEVKEYNIHNMRESRIPVKDGMIVIFPAHLTHSIGINNSNQERYSMAFNYILRGEYGYDDHRLIL